MTRNHDAGRFGGYLARAKESSQALDGWPMHDWFLTASDIAEEAAPASVDTSSMMLHWMEYKHSRDTVGAEHHGSWLSLVDWLTQSTQQERGQKLDMVVWMPTHTRPGRRDEHVTEISCLVLDSDLGVDHMRIHDVLCRAGIAHFGHASPSSTDELPKWRLVLPLSEPIKGEELLKWQAYYTAARLVLGAVGKVWLDSSCHNRARIWYAGRLPMTAQREVWGSHLVDVERSPYRAWRCLDIRELFARFEFASRLDAQRPKTSFRPSPDVPRGTGPSSIDRARAYIQAIPGEADGGSRGPARYKVACAAVRDFELSDADAFSVVSEWNARCSPPAPEKKVRDAIENARVYAKHESGRALNAQAPEAFLRYALTNTAASASFRGAGHKSMTPEQHDEATARHAVKAGLKHQEIVETILARPDGHAQQRGIEYAEKVAQSVKQQPEQKQGLAIDRMEILKSEPPIYTLFIGEASIRVTAAELLNRSRLTVCIMQAIQRVPTLPPTKGGQYTAWVDAMMQEASVIDVGEEASDDFGIREELQHAFTRMMQCEDPDRMPEGTLYASDEGPEVELCLRALMVKLRSACPQADRPTVVRHLRALGWVQAKREINGKQSRVWRGKL